MSGQSIREGSRRPALRTAGLVLSLMISAPAVARAQPAPVPDHVKKWLDELPVWHSAQLGFDYQFSHYVRFRRGALAARVASAPEANSAATRIRRNDTGALITLEPGDLIVAMDEMAFFNRADFDGHMGDTSIYIRDAETGQFLVGRTSLPPTVTPSRRVRGPNQRDPENLFPWWNQRGGPPYPRNEVELKGIVLQSIRDGDISLQPPRIRRPDGMLEPVWLVLNRFSGPVHETVGEQALLESLRTDLGDPLLNRAMAAAAPNIERLIDRQLALLNSNQGGRIADERLDQQIEFQYLYAVFSAAARGQSLPPFTPPTSAFAPVAPAPQYFVRLLSNRRATEILYMPRLNWWIITRSQQRRPQDLEWSVCRIGQEIGMSGYYAYVARYADGAADPPRDDLHITHKGDWTLP